MNPHRLFTGSVVHHRHRPVRHGFRYPMFAVELDVGHLASVPRPLRVNRSGLLTFHERDHGPCDGSPLLPWIRSLLVRHQFHEADGAITLLTLPRLLGYLFNPVSFWFCHDRSGALRAVLAEVRNTFGERHNYLVHRPDHGPIATTDTLPARKVFHVSPFLEIEGSYRFRFDRNGGHTRVTIAHENSDGRMLSTAMCGESAPLQTANLRTAALRMPFQSLAVTARIHWQALQLWVKRVAFHTKPLPPLEETTS